MSKGKKRSRSEERFSRNAETELVCRLLLEKKKRDCDFFRELPRCNCGSSAALHVLLLFFIPRGAARSTLFPYTTLFRSCSRLPCVYAQETLTFLLTQKKTCVKNYVQKE